MIAPHLMWHPDPRFGDGREDIEKTAFVYRKDNSRLRKLIADGRMRFARDQTVDGKRCKRDAIPTLEEIVWIFAKKAAQQRLKMVKSSNNTDSLETGMHKAGKASEGRLWSMDGAGTSGLTICDVSPSPTHSLYPDLCCADRESAGPFVARRSTASSSPSPTCSSC